MFPKRFIPLYLEDLRFLIKRAGWIVTKLYSHFTFEQEAFKKDFVLMNQKSRQNAKNSIEKDFYKLMNNTNFGFDCRNNANNLKFEPLIDEINDLTYIKKYHNLFDNKISDFVNSEILEKNIDQEFDQKIALIKDDDPFKNARTAEPENEKETSINSLNCLKTKEEKSKKRKIKDLQIDGMLKNKKIKTMIDFDKNECNSIKSIIVRGDTNIDVSSRFIKGKMLMFAKLSLKAFVYDMIDVFCFPNEEIQQIYDYYQIEKSFLYQNLTDTDSTSSFFNFICGHDCSVPETEAKKIIFECLKKSKILNRVDLSDEFWKQFEIYNADTKKVMGLYEIENINNQNICTIAVNPKEYFEKFKDRKINKKHKGVRKDTQGMNFESYAMRINTLREVDDKKEEKKIVQKRLQVKNTNMTMTSVNKVQFAKLNNKGFFHFSDGIVSLPFGPPALNKVREYKKSLPQIHTVIQKEKNKILNGENAVVNNNERLRILRSIFSQPITYYNLKTNKRLSVNKFDYTTTRDYILKVVIRWKIMFIMENLVGIF